VLRFSQGHAVDRFATLARTIDDSLRELPDGPAAAECCRVVESFLNDIDLRLTLGDLGVPSDGLARLATQSLVLPDFRNHPRVATESEVLELLGQCT
jgi:alcohol dehydrogenase class IV